MRINSKYIEQSSQPKEGYLNPDVQATFIPVPTDGWNAISPLSGMSPKEAVALVNFVPRPGYIEARGGYNNWSTSLGSGQVESLMVYRPVASGEKLFAGCANKIFDVSSYGTGVDVGVTTSGNRHNYVNITPSGNTTYLVTCNEVDQVRNYNGSVWSIPSITGYNSALTAQLHIHGRRIWMIEKNSSRAWYLGVDSIAGPAQSLDLGSLWSKGSYLVAMSSWNIDGNSGPQSYAVFISNKGQVTIYSGFDPTSATDFVLKGTFDIAPPIGRKCFRIYGSDLLVITLEGVVPLAKALPMNSAADRTVAITNRIQNAMLLAAQNGKSYFGWEICLFPAQSLLIMNVPLTEGAVQQQFVMNTISEVGPWTLFDGWNANCFEIFNESLYFGDNVGRVNLAYTAVSDLFAPIQYVCRCAFNYFGEPGRNKVMSMLRPYVVSGDKISPTLSVSTDFNDYSAPAPLTIIQSSGAVWDVGKWDVDKWSGGFTTNTAWQSVTAVGTAHSVQLTLNVTSTVTPSPGGNGSNSMSGRDLPIFRVNAFEAIIEKGGPI